MLTARPMPSRFMATQHSGIYATLRYASLLYAHFQVIVTTEAGGTE